MPTRYIISVRKVHLVDHHQVILLDPSSPLGYEMKHAALHEGGDYLNSVGAFEAMLKKIAESSDPSIQSDVLYQQIRSHRASRSPGCHVQVVPGFRIDGGFPSLFALHRRAALS